MKPLGLVVVVMKRLVIPSHHFQCDRPDVVIKVVNEIALEVRNAK
jgi:hypothetical protein